MPQNTWLTQLSAKIKILTFFIVVFGFVLGGLFYGYNSTSIKTIEIENVPEGFQISGLSDYKGKNLLLLSEEEVTKKIKSKNPLIKNTRVQKKYPSTIMIAFDLYREEAELNVGTGYFVLSEDGRILSKNKKSAGTKTLINFYQKLNYYSYSSGDYLKINDINDAIYYIGLLENLGLFVDNLDIKDRDMLLCNIGEKTIIFTTSKSRERQKYELSQIIKEFKITGTDYKSIDLRFEKPIIKL